MMRRVLVASAIVHIAAFAWVSRERPAAPTPSAELAPYEPIETEIEAIPLPPETAETPTESEPTRVAAVATPSPRGVAAENVGSSAPTTMASAAPASSATETVAGANSTWSVNLGSGAVAGTFTNPGNPFVSRQQAEQAPAPISSTEKRKDGSLAAMLRAQDAMKGLGPDGPVLRALESETRTSLAPISGKATFRAIVDATGTVTGLHIIESTGGAGWDDARDRAFAALQKKKINVSGNGATIDIRVESELRLPSGATSHLPDIGALSLGGDLGDIGAKSQRVVHARLSNFTPL